MIFHNKNTIVSLRIYLKTEIVMISGKEFFMKKMRFAVIGAAMVLAGGLALAQSSMTYTATKEVFKTDVDNYMDVNTWGGIARKDFCFH